MIESIMAFSIAVADVEKKPYMSIKEGAFKYSSLTVPDYDPNLILVKDKNGNDKMRVNIEKFTCEHWNGKRWIKK